MNSVCQENYTMNMQCRVFTVSLMNGLYKTIFWLKLSYWLNEFCEVLENQSFQDHYILPKWKLSKIVLSEYHHFHRSKNYTKSVLSRPLHLSKVKTETIVSPFKTTTPFQSEDCPKLVLSRPSFGRFQMWLCWVSTHNITTKWPAISRPSAKYTWWMAFSGPSSD